MKRYSILGKSSNHDKPKNKVELSDDDLHHEMKLLLGDGPTRFGPLHKQRSIQEEVKGLSREYVQSFANVKVRWESKSSKKSKRRGGQFTDVQILRVLVYCNFRQDRTISLLSKINNPRHFELNSFDLEEQLKSKTLFPVPGLKTIEPYSSNVFYMRPSRFFPKVTPTKDVIDNLVYVMDHTVATQRYHKTQQHLSDDGVAFIANMNDWRGSNFSTDYCFQFMEYLQGKQFPAKVNLFLIVNPPKWFGKVWKIMKPMLSKSFRKKVFLIPEDELWSYLQVGYEKHLPDEFEDGEASTDQLVEDFIQYRQCWEKSSTTIGAHVAAKSAAKPAKQNHEGKKKRTSRLFPSFASPRRSTFIGTIEDATDITDDTFNSF